MMYLFVYGRWKVLDGVMYNLSLTFVRGRAHYAKGTLPQTFGMVIVITRYSSCSRQWQSVQAQNAHPTETIIDQEVDDHCEGDVYSCYAYVRLCQVKFNRDRSVSCDAPAARNIVPDGTSAC